MLFPDFLRRERDSNPRYLSVRRFSRPVQSTTLPPLQELFFNENVVSFRLMMQRYIKKIYRARKMEKKIIFCDFFFKSPRNGPKNTIIQAKACYLELMECFLPLSEVFAFGVSVDWVVWHSGVCLFCVLTAGLARKMTGSAGPTAIFLPFLICSAALCFCFRLVVMFFFFTFCPELSVYLFRLAFLVRRKR